MNTESEKSTESIASLWKYVTKLEKASSGGGNATFRCNYYKKNFQGVLFKGEGTHVKTA